MDKNVPKAVLKRLPTYRAYLKTVLDEDVTHISATALAAALNMGEVQVRKDLAMVSNGGRPKIGYPKEVLLADIEEFLGYDVTINAVIVGAGRLGRALLGYPGFKEYGLNIVAAFDNDETTCGKSRKGQPILPLTELADYCQAEKVKIGIITVPSEFAQGVCNQLVEAGIQAIWNFAPTYLEVPPEIRVQNENMAASLAMLSKHLSK